MPEAIHTVLARAVEPMHTTAIHGAVERELDLQVNYRTIKACLSGGAKKKEPRFVRVAYGEYRLA